MVEQTPQGTTKGTAGKTAQRKRLKKIHARPSANGGYIVRHHYQPEYGGTPSSEEHIFTKYDDLHGHLEQTMKGHG